LLPGEQLQTPAFDCSAAQNPRLFSCSERFGKTNREDVEMSFVTTQPEALSAAATSLGGIGAGLNAQNAAAAAPTTGVVPAAADEVSALTAAQFAAHAQLYQAVSAQAAAIHEAFVNTLGTSAGSYLATEAANAAAAG
jgi:PE family